MKKLVSVLLLSLPMIAAASNCDEISANIAEKIKNNGVDASQFQLKLVPADQSQEQIEGQVVGRCDHGQQNIVYVRLDDVYTSSKKTEKAESQTQAPVEKNQSEPDESTNESTPYQE
ncbi:hypothetical protein A9G11_10030 [Gilliamella sp. wkB108]|uniref:DUF1161 domain-containing protein n=1 Tax=Gilliamella sp. wkB108 TaxID=3120256 RepID=UPI00080E128A|nr:DUF1161 domain-containing protein [Gilliamella apicola]OCG28779.1 hypothetical protein A9G11_10030 [Gilliamella apicola]